MSAVKSTAGVDQRQQLVAVVVAVGQGDKSAFARLYAATSRKLFGIAMNVLRDRTQAEDVLQEAYVKIWRHARSFDPERASPVSWMTAIVRNAAVDEFRKRRIETVDCEEALLSVVANDPDPAIEIDRSRQRALALAALRTLSADKRKLILQAYIDETTRDELAAQYKLPTGTMKTNIHRTVLILRRLVQDDIADECIRDSKRAA